MLHSQSKAVVNQSRQKCNQPSNKRNFVAPNIMRIMKQKSFCEKCHFNAIEKKCIKILIQTARNHQNS